MIVGGSEERANLHFFRVRPHQTDLNGAMYHGAYLDIFDEARIETFRQMGYTFEDLSRDECAAVIRHVNCDYLAPAYMDELISVTVTIAHMGIARLRIRYICRRDKQVLARAEVEFAFIGTNRKPQRIPAALRHVVERNSGVLFSNGDAGQL